MFKIQSRLQATYPRLGKTTSALDFTKKGVGFASENLVQAQRVSSDSFVNALKAQVRFASATANEPAFQVPESVRQYEELIQKSIPGFKLDPFQVEAMTHLANGRSVMVAAPTSSGKTKVGEFGIELSLKPQFWATPNTPPERPRLFYTAPRKAISNEKFGDFIQEYGQENVGLMTGDVTIRPNAPVVLMTTEVLRNMLYEEPERLKNVGKVVFDECHFVNDSDRGPVWEECMMHMPSDIQQIHLSATVGNAKQYVDWMNAISTQKTELVFEDKRPVPIEYLFYDPNQDTIGHVFEEQSRKPTKAFFNAFRDIKKGYSPKKLLGAMKRYKDKAQVDLLPAVATAFSKRVCDEHFEEVDLQFMKPLIKPEADSPEKQGLQKLVRDHKQLDPDLVSENPYLIDGLMKGYGVHHAGMTYAERSLVEQGIKKGFLKWAWATDTLGAGINVPMRTAVLTQFRKFNGTAFEDVRPSDVHQILGRAGRRGHYDTGYTVIVPPRGANRETAEYIVSVLNSPPDRIESKFKPTPSMVLNLLKKQSLTDAKQEMSRSFAAYQFNNSKSLMEQFDKMVGFLAKHKLITLENADVPNSKVSLTPLGYNLSFVPNSAFVSVMTLLKGMASLNQRQGLETGAVLSDAEKTVRSVMELPESELAVLFSAMLNEKGDFPSLGKESSEAFKTVVEAFLKEDSKLGKDAQSVGIDNQASINFTFAPFVKEWAETGNWKEVRANIESTETDEGNRLYIGDFMNIVRRTSNLLGKLAQMSIWPQPFRDKLSRTQALLLRPPIKESLCAMIPAAESSTNS